MHGKQTFSSILNTTRDKCAERAWQRARLASQLRHIAADGGRSRAASMLGRIKQRAILRVIALSPVGLRVATDRHRYVGLPSISWAGHGRLHLPAKFACRLDSALGRAAIA
ncbi:MAG TPA: hypothetical protein VGP72_31310 [Planctomycetota bacterium]|jgi:hypothetical protein